MTPPSGHRVERRPSWPALVAVAVIAAVGGATLAGGLIGSDDSTGDAAPPVTTPPPTVGIDITDDTTPAAEQPAPFLRDSGTTLLVAEGDRFSVIDLDAGTASVAALPLGGFSEHQPLVVGDRLVIEERYVAYSIDRRFATTMVELGTADSVVPAGGDEVWLVDQREDTATRVAVDGSGSGERITIPDGSWRTLGAGGGLVLSSPRRWRHYGADGRLLREHEGVAVAAQGDVVVWLPPACRTGPCDVHVTDVRTGGDRAIRLSEGALVALYEARLSPDGRWLALTGDLDLERSSYEVVLVDLDGTADRLLLAAHGLTTPPGVVSWSPDGRWLFWSRRRFGSNEAVISAFTITRSSTVELEVTSGSVSTFVAY